MDGQAISSLVCFQLIAADVIEFAKGWSIRALLLSPDFLHTIR